MFFFPLTLIFLIFFFLLPVFILMIQFSLTETALLKLGISPVTAISVIYISLIGSLINIPIFNRRVSYEGTVNYPYKFIGYFSPVPSDKQVIALNVGGAIVPVLICIYLLPKAPFIKTSIAILISMLIAYKLAKPVPMIGIRLPVLIPPVVAISLGLLFSPANPLPVAYISGVLGVLIGADLLNLKHVKTPGIISIGGAGVYDGIFLVGIITALLG